MPEKGVGHLEIGFGRQSGLARPGDSGNSDGKGVVLFREGAGLASGQKEPFVARLPSGDSPAKGQQSGDMAQPQSVCGIKENPHQERSPPP